MDFKTLILQFLNNNDSTINVLNQEQITVMELLFKGGFMMVPILVLFVIVIFVNISIQIQRNKFSFDKFNTDDDVCVFFNYAYPVFLIFDLFSV